MITSSGSRPRRGRVVAAAVVAVGVVGVFAGCASSTSSLRQAATDARSAVSSAELAMTQQASDRTFVTTTQTALGDAITQLDDAQQSATEVESSTPAEVAAQKRTLQEIREATDAVLAAQRLVATDAGSAVPALHTSTHDLTALSDELLKAEAHQ